MEASKHEDNISRRAETTHQFMLNKANSYVQYRVNIASIAASLDSVKNTKDLLKEAKELDEWVTKPLEGVPSVDELRKKLIESGKRKLK